MSLLDKSPGAFIAAANVFLYGTVLTETWMLTTGSLAVMGLVMGLIIALAAFLCRYIMNLMGSEEYIVGEEHVVAVAAAPLVPAATVAVARPAAAVPAVGTPVHA